MDASFLSTLLIELFNNKGNHATTTSNNVSRETSDFWTLFDPFLGGFS
jgi:hypothetical protein